MAPAVKRQMSYSVASMVTRLPPWHGETPILSLVEHPKGTMDTMAHQSPPPGSLRICPHLGRRDDPATIYNYPSEGNFCHAVQPPRGVMLGHQATHCLSDQHITCPLFTGQATPVLMNQVTGHPARRQLPAARRIAAWGGVIALVAILVLAWVVLRSWSLKPSVTQVGVESVTASTTTGPAAVAWPSPSPLADAVALAAHSVMTLTPTSTPVAGCSVCSVVPPSPSPTTDAAALTTPLPVTPSPNSGDRCSDCAIALPSPSLTTDIGALDPPTAATPSHAAASVCSACTGVPPAPSPTPAVRARPVESIVLNVRAGPGAYFPLVGQIRPPADAVAVIGRDPEGAWVQICCLAPGVTGWVTLDFIDLEGSLDEAPVITELPRPHLVTNAWANLRAAPAADAPVVEVSPPQQVFTAIGRNSSGDWWWVCCLVNAPVWVFQDYVTLLDDASYLPVVTPTAP